MGGWAEYFMRGMDILSVYACRSSQVIVFNTDIEMFLGRVFRGAHRDGMGVMEGHEFYEMPWGVEIFHLAPQ